MDMPQSATLIPVLLSCDLNYLQHAAACIASLATNNPNLQFDIIIAGSQDFNSAQQKINLTIASFRNIKCEVVKFDLLDKLTLPLRIHYSVETYTRLWIADFFAGYDRALFLDPDLIVTSAIDELWNADLANRTVAAVPIPGSTRPAQLGMAPGSSYFQSGVLVFDLQRWRQRRYTERCLEILTESPEKAIDADQDILNLCLEGDWTALPYYWNVISPFFFHMHDLGLPESEIAATRRNARIIHFNGMSKPWSYMSRHPRRAEYWKYLRLTEWRDYTPFDRSALNWAKKTVGRFIPEAVRARLRRG